MRGEGRPQIQHSCYLPPDSWHHLENSILAPDHTCSPNHLFAAHVNILLSPYVCVCICVYLYTHIHMCLCVFVYIYVYMCVFVCVFVYICVYVLVCVYIHTWVHAWLGPTSSQTLL